MPSSTKAGVIGLGRLVEQRAGRDFRRLDVRLVERVDTQKAARNRNRIFPRDHLGAERAGDLDLAGGDMSLVGGRTDQADDLHVVQVLGELGRIRPRTTGRMPLPCLPVDSAMSCSAQSAKPTMWVPSATMPSLSRSGLVRGDRGGEHEPRVRVVVGGQLEDRRTGLVEECVDVDAGETGWHETECGQRGVAAADIGVGVEDVIAVGASRHVEWRSRVGYDDDAASRVDTDVA